MDEIERRMEDIRCRDEWLCKECFEKRPEQGEKTIMGPIGWRDCAECGRQIEPNMGHLPVRPSSSKGGKEPTTTVSLVLLQDALNSLEWLWVNAQYKPDIGWENNGARVMITVDKLRAILQLGPADWGQLAHKNLERQLRIDAEREAALAELAEQAQELGMGYEDRIVPGPCPKCSSVYVSLFFADDRVILAECFECGKKWKPKVETGGVFGDAVATIRDYMVEQMNLKPEMLVDALNAIPSQEQSMGHELYLQNPVEQSPLISGPLAEKLIEIYGKRNHWEIGHVEEACRRLSRISNDKPVTPDGYLEELENLLAWCAQTLIDDQAGWSDSPEWRKVKSIVASRLMPVVGGK